MTSVFIAVLLMSATGALLVLCLSLLHPLTRKRLNASWHYRMYIAVVLFMLVPVGILGGRLFSSIPDTAERELPDVPVFLNDIMTTRQTVAPPQAGILPQQTGQVLPQAAPDAGTPGSEEPAAPAFTVSAVLPLLPVIWLAGFLVFVIWQGVLLVRFKRKIMRTGLPVEDAERLAIIGAITAQAGVKGRLRLLSSGIVKTPMLTGLFKTYLILPEVEMSDRELGVILRHELTHFKRRDLWAKSLALLANAVHWFNPAAYLLTKRINTFCELSCDELVVADMDMEERQFYGETILNVLCRVVSQHAGVYATLAESKKGLQKRLAHMMGVRKSPRRIIFMSLAAAVVLCLLGLAVATLINITGDNRDNKEAEEIITGPTDDGPENVIETPVSTPPAVIETPPSEAPAVSAPPVVSAPPEPSGPPLGKIDKTAEQMKFIDADGNAIYVGMSRQELEAVTGEVFEDGWITQFDNGFTTVTVADNIVMAISSSDSSDPNSARASYTLEGVIGAGTSPEEILEHYGETPYEANAPVYFFGYELLDGALSIMCGKTEGGDVVNINVASKDAADIMGKLLGHINQRLSGTGNMFYEGTALIYYGALDVTYSGPGRIKLTAIGADGVEQVLLDRPGDYHGRIMLPEFTPYDLRIEAEGDWIIKSLDSWTDGGGAFNGNGDFITTGFSSVLAKWRVTHSGSGAFKVIWHRGRVPGEGAITGNNISEVLVDTVGAYDGEAQLEEAENNIGFFEIIADGEWSITVAGG